jgi:hypothetical protein
VSEQRTSAASRFLNGLANALLERTLPTIRAWLTARLGPSVAVAQMTVEGSTMRLEGALLPLGPGMELEVKRAVFALQPELVRGGVPVRLRELEGELRSIAPKGTEPFRAPVTFAPSENASRDAWVDGQLTTRNATWPVRTGQGTQAPLDGVVALLVTSESWSMARGDITCAAARVRLDARGRVDDPSQGLIEARLVASEARAGHFVDALAALSGALPPALSSLPWDAIVDCDLAYLQGGASRIDLRARTQAGSALTVEGTISGGETVEARARGTIEASEAVIPHAVREGLVAFGVKQLAVEAMVSGTTKEPVLEVELRGSANGLHAELTLERDKAKEGMRGALRVKTVTSDLALEPFLFGPTGLQTSRLIGTLSVRDARALGFFGPGPVLPTQGVVFGDLEVTETRDEKGDSAFVIEGPISTKSLVLAWEARPHATPIAIEDASAVMRFDAHAFTLRAIYARAFHGSLRGDLTIPLAEVLPKALASAPRLAMSVSNATGLLVERAVEWSSTSQVALDEVSRFLRVPNVMGEVQLAWAASGAVLAKMRLRGRSMDVTFDMKVSSEGRLRGSTVTGHIDLVQWVRLERIPGLESLRFQEETLSLQQALQRLRTQGASEAILQRASAELQACLDAGGSNQQYVQRPLKVNLEGLFAGPVHEPAASIQLRVPELICEHDALPKTASLRLEDIAIRLLIDAEKVAWEGASLRGYDGRLTTSGMWSASGHTPGLRCEVKLADVDLERLPIQVDGQPLSSSVRGRLHADARISKTSPGAPVVSASVRIESASLPALKWQEAQLSQLGLPLPSLACGRPITADVDYASGALRVERLSIDIGDAAANGSLTLDAAQRLHGLFEVRLRDHWLRRSALLFVPATFTGDVDVPVTIAGTREEPVVDYDLRASLKRIARGNALGRVLADVLAPAPPPPAQPPPTSRTRPTEEAILDGVLDDVPGADALLVELMERGYSPREISAKLDARLLARRARR